ncbi:MAG TPA: hypothetical protein VG097_19600 [Gemmata sp.]|jgi:hypothetical protein|nr:hypothetical protein [Gemmata sp.]
MSPNTRRRIRQFIESFSPATQEAAGSSPVAPGKSSSRSLNYVDESICDNALVEKAVTRQLAAITCPSCRFYIQVEWICKRWPTPKEQILFLLILSGRGQLHASR